MSPPAIARNVDRVKRRRIMAAVHLAASFVAFVLFVLGAAALLWGMS